MALGLHTELSGMLRNLAWAEEQAALKLISHVRVLAISIVTSEHKSFKLLPVSLTRTLSLGLTWWSFMGLPHSDPTRLAEASLGYIVISRLAWAWQDLLPRADSK